MIISTEYPDFIVPVNEHRFFDYIDSIKYVLSYAKEYLLSLPIDQQGAFVVALNVILKKWYDESGWAPFEGLGGPYTLTGHDGDKFIIESGNVNGFTRQVSPRGKVIEKESYWHGEYKFEQL